jgi:hypothetical protein
VLEINPSTIEGCAEEFVRAANSLQPGDTLVLHPGIYSQTCRRKITGLHGTPDRQIVITAAGGTAVLTRPEPRGRLGFSIGGPASGGFGDPTNRDWWPRPESPLIGSAATRFLAETDFNGVCRSATRTVGAYETDGRTPNPGWAVRPGFKNGRSHHTPTGSSGS